MAISDSQRKAIDRWDAENTKKICLKLMKDRDRELLDYWSKITDKTNIFRAAMSDYMEKHPIKD